MVFRSDGEVLPDERGIKELHLSCRCGHPQVKRPVFDDSHCWVKSEVQNNESCPSEDEAASEATENPYGIVALLVITICSKGVLLDVDQTAFVCRANAEGEIA